MQYSLHYGDGQKKLFDLPDSWNVLNYCDIVEKKGMTDKELREKLVEGFKDPIGTKGLHKLLKKDMNIALLIDDATRPTQCASILKILIEWIKKEKSSTEDNLTIMIGCGIHRGMTNKEFRMKVGESIADNIQWINHDPNADMEDLGTSSYGTPIQINKKVIEADFRIAIGTIEPHPFAGFSGGSKMIMPGFASIPSIIANHEKVIDDNSTVGKVENNSLREDIDEIGQIAGLDFIINVISNSKREPLDIVMGHPYKAHRKGVEISKGIYETPIEEQSDILIVSANPLYLDARQSGKCALNNKLAVKRGGKIIIVSECPEGMGNIQLEGRQPPKLVIKLLAKLFPKEWLLYFIQKIKKYPIEDSVNLWLMFRLLARNELIFVSKLTDEDRKKAFIFTHFDNMPEAIQYVEKKRKKDKPLTVNIMPLGGATYPSKK